MPPVPADAVLDAHALSSLRPLDGARSRRIAKAFAPRRLLGNRHDYFYTLIKLRSDPLYPGVLAALRGTKAPVLDLGCGLGLLSHALRQDGQSIAYRGVDIDADKIARGARVAADCGLRDVRLEVMDVGVETPKHCGSVTILDVLQFLDLEAQRALLTRAASMIAPRGRLVIRTGLLDESGRSRTSRMSDRFANLVGWMQERPRNHPTMDGLRGILEDAELKVSAAPLYGGTPFNNWLLVATPASPGRCMALPDG
jgi:SAM-dependent methyltransferase